MLSLTRIHLSLIILSGLCILIAACGGGGGGGGGGIADNVKYSGSASPAAINSTNAEPLALEAAMFNGSDAITAGPSALKPGGTGTGPGLDVVASNAHKTLMRLIRPYAPGTKTANYSESSSATGDCGGSYSSTITINESTFDFTGSMNYSSFCDSVETEGATLNGHMSFSMSLMNSSAMSMNFVNYGYTDDADTFTMSGTINYTISFDTMTMEIPELRHSTGGGDVYKVENYVITMGDYVTYYTMDIESGKFYDPVEGSIFVNTPVTIEIYNGSEYPYTGLIRIEGESGGFANVTFINETSYHVLVDSPPGDGFEVDETLFW